MKNKLTGFTLIELLVVMVIIGLLAAVAVPKFLDITLRAEAASVKSIIGSTRSALSLRLASEIVKGTDISTLAAGGSAALQPMTDLLSDKPEDFIGETSENPTATNKGQWQDLTATVNIDGLEVSTPSLVYTLINDGIIEAPTDVVEGSGGWTVGGIKNIRQLITLVRVDDNDTSSPAAGLSLSPIEAEKYSWTDF